MCPVAAEPSAARAELAEQNRVRAARTAVAFVFGLNGFGLASWFSRVPAARDALELSSGQLGLLLLSASVGSIVALPTAGVVTRRLGVRRTVGSAAVLLGLGLALVGSAVSAGTGPLVVGVGLVALGFASGTCEVAMNVEGALVERRLGRTIMPRFHGAWSLGTVAAAGVAALVTRTDLPVAAHLVPVAAVVAGGSLLAVRSFLSTPQEASVEDESEKRASSNFAAWREPRTLLVGLLVLAVAFTEGTANDWLAVAFIDGYGASEALGAAVFGVFVGAMTLGRIFGTHALDRWGRVQVLTVTMLLAAAGAAVTVFANSTGLAIAGVALWGIGVSLGFPVGMSAAADDEEHAAARVSVVAVIGYTAFLAGPPAVGFLGDEVGTLRALLIVPLLLLPALALVPATRPPVRIEA